jgi:protein arginine N-methyltransferase 1
MTLNNAYVRLLKPAELLDHGTSAVLWDSVDLTRETRAKRKGQGEWRLAKPATIYGFAVWWVAELRPGISLSTAPSAPHTHWEQLYFPLAAPIEAKARDRVAVELRSNSSEEGGTHLAWTAIHRNAQGAVVNRHAHDLNKGYLP